MAACHSYPLGTLPRCTFTKGCYVAATIPHDLLNKDYELAYTCIESRRSALLALAWQQP
jgi:hypothetical protein